MYVCGYSGTCELLVVVDWILVTGTEMAGKVVRYIGF